MQLCLSNRAGRGKPSPKAADLQIDFGPAFGGWLANRKSHRPRQLKQALYLRVSLEREAVSGPRSPAAHGRRRWPAQKKVNRTNLQASLRRGRECQGCP